MNVFEIIQGTCVGTTIRKDDLLGMMLKIPIPQSFQVLLGGRYQAGKVKGELCNQICEALNKTPHRVFNHSPYTINLTNEEHLAKLCESIYGSHLHRFRGTVVHVGKAVKMNRKEAIEKMVFNVNKVINTMIEVKADLIRCPLLIETPAGQGTELGHTIEEFSDIFTQIQSVLKDKRHVQICVDTCHVFAAGYEPDEYIMRWQSLHPDTIKLIHFNGSKEEKGSRKDRHAFTDSKINNLYLKNVIDWATSNDVPMVTE